MVRILTIWQTIRHHADGIRVAAVGIMLTLIALLTAFNAKADAQPHVLAEIEKSAERYVSTNSGVGTATAMALDPRLRLARCDRPLETFLRPGTRISQRTVVGVRCPGQKPWKVYVPVNLVVERPVVVLSKPLPRGHELKSSDLQILRRDVSRLAGGYATSIDAVVGLKLKQSLRAGAIITPLSLARQTLVKRGQTVTLQADSSGIAIRVAGKALMDGAQGQRIRVQNSASGRVVEGLVRSREVVEILVN